VSLRTAAQQALEALEDWKEYLPRLWDEIDEKAVTALRAALAEPEQEFVCSTGLCRYRKPLTDEEIWREYQGLWPFHPAAEPKLAADIAAFARAIERAHGIGGEA
jgi:hypothetical protein